MTSDVLGSVSDCVRGVIHTTGDRLRGLTEIQRQIILVVVIGLILRYVLGLFWTYPRDVASWCLNSENFLMGEGLYGLPGHYYTPVWGYIMALLTAVAGFIGIPITIPNPFFDGSQSMAPWYTDLPSMEYAMLVKTFLFVIDLLVGYVIYRIATHERDERTGLILFTIWFLCPLTIVMSSIRVMFENVEILFMLLSVLMVLERRYSYAGFAIGISLLVKPYGLFLGLLLLGFIFARSRNHRDVLTYLAFVVISCLIVMLPVLISGELEEAMHWLTARTDNPGSGYNVTLYLMPVLIVLSLAISYVIAWKGFTGVSGLMCSATLLTGAMLIAAGNIQYYLLLLPMALLMFSRTSVAILIPLTVMAFLAWLSFSSWSIQLYASYGLWGSDALMAWGEYIYQFESNLDYSLLKSMTGVCAVVVPSILTLYRWKYQPRGDAHEA